MGRTDQPAGGRKKRSDESRHEIREEEEAEAEEAEEKEEEFEFDLMSK